LPILTLKGLKVEYATGAAPVAAVDRGTLEVSKGQVVGLVGESGCGKTTTGRLLTRLEEPTGGHIMFGGVDIASLEGHALFEFRRNVQMIFQDPYESLNPRYTVFRAVSGMEREGAIKRIDLGDGKVHYELSEDHHEHIRCDSCGRVVEVPGCVLEDAERSVKSSTGFVVTSHQLLFSGVCPDCAAEAGAR